MARVRHKEIRFQFWLEDPSCRYCGEQTVLPEGGPNAKAKPNWATLDHVFSRLHPFRRDPRYHDLPDRQKYVLACWNCNCKRGVAEVKRLTQEELDARSNLGTRRSRRDLPHRGVPPLRRNITGVPHPYGSDLDVDGAQGLDGGGHSPVLPVQGMDD